MLNELLRVYSDRSVLAIDIPIRKFRKPARHGWHHGSRPLTTKGCTPATAITPPRTSRPLAALPHRSAEPSSLYDSQEHLPPDQANGFGLSRAGNNRADAHLTRQNRVRAVSNQTTYMNAPCRDRTGGLLIGSQPLCQRELTARIISPAGFEPATSPARRERDDQASLQADRHPPRSLTSDVGFVVFMRRS